MKGAFIMRKLTISEIQERIKNRFPDEEFEIITYTSLGDFGSVKCCNCGKIIDINKFSNFFAPSKKYGCSACQSEFTAKREEGMAKILKKYDIVGEYVKDTHKNYDFKCKNCGHIRSTTPRNLLRFLECGCQTGVKRARTAQEFIDEANANSIDGRYTLVGEYVNQTTPVLLKHSCGFIWKVRPGDVVHGRSRCPKCCRKRSKGELLIENLLSSYNIDFYMEKLLDNGSKQRFDFYLENKKHKIAIEYNGLQHYEETNFFVGDLATFQERDKRKAQYCKEQNIDLYIIPYTASERKITKIISDIIDKFND